MITDILGGILILAALLFGAVETWSMTAVLFMIFTLGLVWILKKDYSRYEIDRNEKLLVLTGLLMLAYGVLQVVPMPSSFLKILSPSAHEVYHTFALEKDRSMYLSVNTYRTVREILNIAAFFTVFYISMINFRNTEALSRTMHVLVIAGFFIALFALIQKATGADKIYWFRELTMGGSPAGPFVNRNHYSGFIGMIIPMGLGLAFSRRKTEKKVLFGFITLIMAVSLFFSLSRGGMVSFFVGLVFFVVMMFAGKYQMKKILIIGMFLALLVAYVLYLGVGPILERFSHGGVSSKERIIVWTASWEIFKNYWLTGSGLGTFINIFPRYSPAATNIFIFDHAHNDYLEFLVETGLGGSMILLGFVALIALSLIRTGLQGRRGLFKIAVISSIATMAVHSVVDFNLHITSNMLLFASLLGMAVALSHPSAQTKDDPENIAESDALKFVEKKAKVVDSKLMTDGGGEDWERDVQ